MNVIPSNYKESIFAPLQKKEIDLMDVEQSMIHSVFQDGTTVVHAGLIFFLFSTYSFESKFLVKLLPVCLILSLTKWLRKAFKKLNKHFFFILKC